MSFLYCLVFGSFHTDHIKIQFAVTDRWQGVGDRILVIEETRTATCISNAHRMYFCCCTYEKSVVYQRNTIIMWNYEWTSQQQSFYVVLIWRTYVAQHKARKHGEDERIGSHKTWWAQRVFSNLSYTPPLVVRRTSFVAVIRIIWYDMSKWSFNMLTCSDEEYSDQIKPTTKFFS